MQKSAKHKPKKQANFNQNKPKNKQLASLQETRKSTKKQAQIRGENASLATLLQRQVAKLASGLLYSRSLLRNNNMAVNLQMFTLSYSSRRFAACDQGSH